MLYQLCGASAASALPPPAARAQTAAARNRLTCPRSSRRPRHRPTSSRSAAPKAPRAGGTGLPAKPGSAAAAGGQAFHTAVAEAKEELRQELLTLAKEFNGGETIKASLQQHRERMDAARINLKKVGTRTACWR